jgi:1-acyl-sn-glycerol-3-phosphate acyltransferase
MCRVNPLWRIRLSGQHIENPRRPYVVVSNHQSHADIPILSHLPWEMKWIGKKVLFSLPFIGWMMKLAGDIPVDRADRRSGAKMLLTAKRYLDQKCSVMFFPEGTRSPDGRVGRFNDGAFHLAIKAQVPILPVAVEGSYDCLPKRSWKFGEPSEVQVQVLPEVATEGLTTSEAGVLNEKVRRMIIEQVASFRGVLPSEIDVTNPTTTPAGS